MTRALASILSFVLIACGSSSKGDRRAFLIAAENGDIAVVREQLSNGVQADDVFQINDRPALFLAAMNGHPEVVELLLQNGADVHHTHLGASLKMEVTAHWGHVKNAHAKPGSDSTYKKQDGSLVPMRSLRLNDSDYERVLKSIDEARARTAK
ncbi:MAG: ankyrin repeat domain-containing protein [Planctomycetota bacterium]|nr:ankyrin repeat domain-containing protein [Planctomycetota bacterium]